MDAARHAALSVLIKTETEGAYLNLALDGVLKAEKTLDRRDCAFVSELSRGVVKNRDRLDFIIDSFSSVKRKKMTPYILNILRMGIYQIYDMDRVPSSAAVNESVVLAKRYGHAASARFVNAVLRTAARTKEPKPKEEPIDMYLSITKSFPVFMVRRFLDIYGEKRTENILDALNSPARLSVRVNTLKTTPERLKQELGAEYSSHTKEMLILSGTGAVDRMPAYKNGLFTVQDEAFYFVAKALDAKPGMTVWDTCAAPGGKTTHIAQMMENKGKIYASDIYAHKLELIRQAAKRLGISVIEPMVYDASVKNEQLKNSCDRVLVDAPCSGWGIIRRRPDIKWNRTEDDEYERLQSAILDAAAYAVKPGGVLVYSTCTFNPKENEGVVDRFLSAHTEFSKSETADLPGGARTFMPDTDNTDGAYICRLVRK